MVNFGGEKEYRFSKPKQVADSPPVPATPQDGAFKPVEPVKPFVFSPPLLRSASRERKTLEFARLGLDSSETRQVTAWVCDVGKGAGMGMIVTGGYGMGMRFSQGSRDEYEFFPIALIGN